MNKKPIKIIAIFALFFVLLILSGNKAKALNEPESLLEFKFTFGQQEFNVDQVTLKSWQTKQTINNSLIFRSKPQSPVDLITKSLGTDSSESNDSKTYNYDLNKIYLFIKQLSAKINVSSIEPSLQIQNNQVTAFTPPQTGQEVDIHFSAFRAETALNNGQNFSELTVVNTEPKKSLSETNSLGINELIGQGSSNFKGSPKNRRHNIAVGLEKFKGLIIAPGQEFSFNQNLGPVTAEAGFLPELVIKGSQGTIPELGGGLCQVSTTVFRAAMTTGLPITTRRNHAYAVQYYSPQGTDATIYPGSADLKFINNTPASILIWAYEKDANTLNFDFYGTGDGRQVTLEKPVVYDRKTDGSMRASWTRIVTKDGTTSTSTFKSFYQSPSLFHKSESFVSATGTVISGLKMPAEKTQ